MKLTSKAFKEGENIPERYTMYGANEIPPLTIEEVPSKAKSMALIVDDPDAPSGNFTHWLVFNIKPDSHDLGDAGVPPGAMEGLNDYGIAQYGGPRPPAGEHRYFFKSYALDAFLPLNKGCERKQIETAMKGHVLATATLMGKYAH